MAFKLAPAYKYDITVQQEFCEHFSIHYIFYTNGFCESNTSSKNIYLGQEIYSEYNHNQNGAVINVEFNLIGNGKKSVYIRCPTRSGGLIVLRNAYECYIYFNCSQNANTAVNWKNDTNLIPQQPQANFSQLQYPNTYLAPTFDLYRYFNETKVITHSI